jgi:hypothetical protein
MSASVPAGCRCEGRSAAEEAVADLRVGVEVPASGSENSGSASSHSVVAMIENCASRSQTSQ